MGRPRTIFVNDIYSNKVGLEYKVIKYLGDKKYIVEFLDTTYQVTASNGNVKAGKVKDPTAENVANIGSRGNPREYIRKEYDAWKNMLYRVQYNSSYADVTVCNRWLIFEQFLEDIPKLKNYNEWYRSESRAWALDKDVKIKGNRTYCPSACMFVTVHDNVVAVRHKSLKVYSASNKDLNIKLTFCNQRKFSNEYGLNYKNVSRAIKIGGSTKGWIFETCKD